MNYNEYKNESNQQRVWECPKCGCKDFEKDQFAATGGGFSKIFDVQNKKFITISCTNCGFSELYKEKTSMLGNVFDFFAGS